MHQTFLTGLNFAGICISYAMLGLSIWLAPINIATKGYWAMGVLLLTICLINYVKHRFDDDLSKDRIARLERAKNERILSDYVEKAA